MTVPSAVPSTLDLAGWTVTRQHRRTTDWVDPDHRVMLLADEHGIDVELATDRDVAVLRRDRFAPGLSADIFLNRWVDRGEAASFMISMRYEGGDPSRPFVDLSAITAEPTDTDLAAAAEAAAEAFGALRPLYLRVWSSREAGAIPGSGPDKRFLAAPLGELLADSPDVPLRLARATDLSHYADAAEAYRSIGLTHPDHADQARLQPEEDLRELVDERLMFDVLLDRRWVGYVAVRARSTLGLPGFCVTEWILSAQARGHGHGRWLTGLLARALVADGAPPEHVLLGTVHQDNVGAIRAALAGGRHDVGGWVTLPIWPADG